MSRSGYTDDYDHIHLYRATVERSIRGKRGQAFLRELAEKMDAMPEKVLIADELIDDSGNCCAIGVVCKARGIGVDNVDYECPDAVGSLVGISRSMAAEIEYENDGDCDSWNPVEETPSERWERMRKWVGDNLISSTADE